jgi:hypothetical protein
MEWVGNALAALCAVSSRPEPGAQATVALLPCEPDAARMTHVELAEQFGLDPEALRKRLDRWRKHNGTGWEELKDVRHKQPRYVYEMRAVRHLLE